MADITPGTPVQTPDGEGIVDKCVWADPSIPEPVWLVRLVKSNEFRSFRQGVLTVLSSPTKVKTKKGTDSISSDLIGSRWRNRKNQKIWKYVSLSLEGVVRLDLEGTPGYFYNVLSRNLESRYERVA